MSGKTDVPQAIVGLLSRDATSQDGLTAKQIAEQLNISYPTVARWLRSLPGITKSLRPVHPRGYWFDVAAAVEQHGKDAELPETFFGPRVDVKYYPKVDSKPTPEQFKAAHGNVDATTEGLKKTIELVDEAIMNAQSFAAGKAQLDEELQRSAHNQMVAARRSLEAYCKFFAAYQDDPRYQTPEYWTVYL